MINVQKCKREKQAIDLLNNTRAAEFISCKTETSREFLRIYSLCWHHARCSDCGIILKIILVQLDLSTHAIRGTDFDRSLRNYEYFQVSTSGMLFICVQHFQTLLRDKDLRPPR